MTANSVMIVDQYRRYALSLEQGTRIDPVHEAAVMSQLVNAFGRNQRRLALVNTHDTEGLQAYSDAHFEIVGMNGERNNAIHQFVWSLTQEFQRAAPQHLVIVSDDGSFSFLVDTLIQKGGTFVSVWVPGKRIVAPFNQPQYNARSLSELIKTPKVDIRLDYENLHIGLKRRGWKPNAKVLMEALKLATRDLGDILRTVAYADWGLLSREDGQDWQRELATLNIETRYLVNERGKNTADMKIAEAIRDLIERSSGASDAPDVIVLGTNDRDFRAVLETARQRGQRVVIVGLRDGVSRHLLDVVGPNDIRYLDEHLLVHPETADRAQPVQVNRTRSATSPGVPSLHPRTEFASLVVDVAAWLQRQGVRGWSFAPTPTLIAAVRPGPDGAGEIERAVQAGHLIRKSRVGPQGESETLALNRNSELVKAVQVLIQWTAKRLHYCLHERSMPYVDSNYLATGMTKETQLAQLGVGQKRHEAEGWLNLLAQAGVIEVKEQPHPKEPTKLIRTWWLPSAPSAPARHEPPASDGGRPGGAPATQSSSQDRSPETVPSAQVPQSPPTLEASALRALLRERLSDEDLAALTYDHYRAVYERFGTGMGKSQKVHLLIEYVTNRHLEQELLERMRMYNPHLVGEEFPKAA